MREADPRPSPYPTSLSLASMTPRRDRDAFSGNELVETAVSWSRQCVEAFYRNPIPRVFDGCWRRMRTGWAGSMGLLEGLADEEREWEARWWHWCCVLVHIQGEAFLNAFVHPLQLVLSLLNHFWWRQRWYSGRSPEPTRTDLPVSKSSKVTLHQSHAHHLFAKNAPSPLDSNTAFSIHYIQGCLAEIFRSGFSVAVSRACRTPFS